MGEKPTSGFKIHLDDGVEDAGVKAEAAADHSDETEKKERRKPARNLSWMFYGLMTLVVAAMVFGYFDIRGRLLLVYDSGSKETQNLSQDLESKFSSLAVKLSNMEASLEELTAAQSKLSSTVTSLETADKKTEKTISGISASKADKKSLASSTAKLEKQLSSLSESIKKNSAAGAVVSAELKAAMNEVNSSSAQVSEEINALNALLDAFKADKASKKDLLAEIDHIENVLKTNQAATDRQTAGILQTVQRLDMRTSALEAKAGLPMSSEENHGTGSSPASTETNTAPSPTAPSALPKPGELIERDISQ